MEKKYGKTHLHTVTNNTVFHTIIIGIVTINLCKITVTMKLHV